MSAPIDLMFYEAFAEEEAALRRYLPAGCRAAFTSATAQAGGHTESPAPLLSIRTQSVIPQAWWPATRGILARTTGTDHLARYRSTPSLALAALPEYCSRAVAEQAALLWMALLRRLPAQLKQWPLFERDGLTGCECEGRTLVVAGVGRIGREVVRIGRGLGMTVLGVELNPREPGLEYAPWEEAAPRADVVVACMDLTDGNRRYFRHETLALVKPGALLINVARGELVDTRDALAALESGTLGGLALDVFADEEQVADALRGLAPANRETDLLRRLAQNPRALCTPHNAFNTQEAVERKSRLTAEQAIHFLETGRFRWPWPHPGGATGAIK